MSRKTGQFAFEPNELQRELVAILAGNGIQQHHIARFVTWPDGTGLDAKTLRKHFKRELADGRGLADAKLIATAFDVATKDRNASVLIFLLKTRLGWKEPASEVNLTMSYKELVLAAAAKAEEERKARLTLVPGGKAA